MVRGVRFPLLGLSMRPWCPLGQERTQPGPPWFAGVSTDPALILPAAPLSPSAGQVRQLGCLCRPARKQPCLPSPFLLSRGDKETEEEWPGQGDITAGGGGRRQPFHPSLSFALLCLFFNETVVVFEQERGEKHIPEADFCRGSTFSVLFEGEGRKRVKGESGGEMRTSSHFLSVGPKWYAEEVPLS